LALVAAILLTAVQPVRAGGLMRPVVALPSFSAAPDASAAAYCTSTGGVVEHRKPVYGTNNPPSQQLVLSGEADFCQYTLKKDGSRIHLLLTTLVAKLPTLATLAYYAKVPTSNASCPGGANPASCYCTYLGGSDQFGGANLAGGAWVGKGVDVDLETCIFPDLSSIDSWGLTYHANNIIRGIDLSKVLQYHKH
jgi:putative hemolysin